jgi:hypothetical protein
MYRWFIGIDVAAAPAQSWDRWFTVAGNHRPAFGRQ